MNLLPHSSCVYGEILSRDHNWKGEGVIRLKDRIAEERWYRLTSAVREDPARLTPGLTTSLEDCELANCLTSVRGTSGEVRFHRLVSLAALVLDAIEQEELRQVHSLRARIEAYLEQDVGDESIHGTTSEEM